MGKAKRAHHVWAGIPTIHCLLSTAFLGCGIHPALA